MIVFRGCLIAFFGPDGSGKSTTADLVEKLCHDNGVKTARYHWRPRILPSLNKNVDDFPVSNPDDLRARPWIVSFLMYFYFYSDFAIAYLLKLRPVLERGEVIIYERYYYDALFHPTRYKLKPMPTLGRLLSRIVPRPDLVILMKGDAAKIHERKPELSVSEIERQLVEMESYLPKYSNMLEIDVVDNKPGACAKQIFEKLYKLD